MRNIIDAIVTLVERNNFSLSNTHLGNNRLNQSGYALEDYIKNLFADTFDDEEHERLEKWCKTFSYLGNDANSPDMMLENGDAIYGRDYCASEECYERIRTRIKNGVETISNVEFAPTRELGRINRVDPLGITYLRIRGMWHIENALKVFNYIYKRRLDANFSFMCVINLEKWASLDNREKLSKMVKVYPELKISDVRIKNPDNPAKLNDAKLVVYEI